MPQVVPPPPERFDPITERWLTPGGPLHDPQRDSVDPEHAQPVELVAPVPRELAEAEESAPPTGSSARSIRWVVLAVAATFVAAVILGFRSGSCPDPGECSTVIAGGPPGWIAVAALAWLAVYAVRRAVIGGRRDRL